MSDTQKQEERKAAGQDNVRFTFQRKEYIKRTIKPWTTEEDELLINLSKKHKENWNTVASYFPSRNLNQCLHRYRRLKGIQSKKEIWSPTQDDLVLKLVQKIGTNWGAISKHLRNKTGKQIRERYINKLDPSIKTEDWTKEQDHIIISMYNEIGSKWNQISKRLIGRPENKVKNRFYSHIKRFYLTESYQQKEEPILKQEAPSSMQMPINLPLQAMTYPLPKAMQKKASGSQINEQMLLLQNFNVSRQSIPILHGNDYDLMPALDQPRLKEKSSFFKFYQNPVIHSEAILSCNSIIISGIMHQ